MFVIVWLSVPVQSIAWNDSSFQNDLLCVEWDVKSYTLSHSSMSLSYSCDITNVRSIAQTLLDYSLCGYLHTIMGPPVHNYRLILSTPTSEMD